MIADGALPIAKAIIAQAILVFLWVLLAEAVRRHAGRRTLWIVTGVFVALATVNYITRVRPRVYPEASLTLALLSIFLLVVSQFIAPALALERAARSLPAPFLRQAGIGTIVGILTFVIGFLVLGLAVFVLARLGWSAT